MHKNRRPAGDSLGRLRGLPENALRVGIVEGVVYLSFGLGEQPGKAAIGYYSYNGVTYGTVVPYQGTPELSLPGSLVLFLWNWKAATGSLASPGM